jgi:hypothetical protein
MPANETRQLLVKAKLYRTFSLIFVTIGIFMFCFLYISQVEGRLLEALRDPYTIMVFLIPFMPAAVLTWIADRFEKKYLAAVKKPH